MFKFFAVICGFQYCFLVCATQTPQPENRLQKGLDAISQVGKDKGHGVIAALNEISPDFARLAVEINGEIYSRKEIDFRSREIAAIASLVTLGYAIPQLKVHIHAALNVGLTPKEIVEVIMHVMIYVGFPATVNALLAAKEVFEERNVSPLV